MAEIEMPQLGETVTEGTITRWFKKVGESVAVDEVLFEVSTDKVDTEVPSTSAGTLTEIKVAEGETVDVGTVLAVVGDGAAAPAEAAPAEAAPAEAAPAEAAPAEAPSAPEPEVQAPPDATPPPPPPPPAASPPPPERPAASPPPPTPPAQPQPVANQPAASAGNAAGKVLSPVVRRLVNTYGIDASQITGSGLGGRVSRDDVQRYIEANGLQPVGMAAAPAAPATAPASPPPAPPAAESPAPAPAPAPVARVASAPVVQAGQRDTVVPLSNIRLRTGEHMVMSKAVAPHTLTAMEIDYENVEQVRKKHGSEFKSDEGMSLTYLPFISRAVIDALREYPHLNASVGDGELVVHSEVNLGVAVDLDFQGLLAPVVRGADGMRMRAVARAISDIARRARSKQLSPDELVGGTFTLTNAGSYGTMMQFPIINQPQVAILSTDAVKRKPVVIEDEYGNESIAIHSVGVLAMAWDHRAVDGAYAAAFLARVRDILETRDWNAELA
ncbi:MAG: 2-oxo acid dehydrogenase subunit E2 [Acidimicrobiales bacterium]|nr:2-oxo acid dehydrogenase subunit E2 [Acidimicrobiales bacterium]